MKIDTGSTAWMLASTALVLLMTPALAFFYGGLVRSKNALNTMMMSFISLGFVGRVGPSSATRWRSAPATTGSATRPGCSSRGVGLEPGARAQSRTCCSCPIQGTFAIITAR